MPGHIAFKRKNKGSRPLAARGTCLRSGILGDRPTGLLVSDPAADPIHTADDGDSRAG